MYIYIILLKGLFIIYQHGWGQGQYEGAGENYFGLWRCRGQNVFVLGGGGWWKVLGYFPILNLAPQMLINNDRPLITIEKWRIVFKCRIRIQRHYFYWFPDQSNGKEATKKMIFGIATRIDLLNFITKNDPILSPPSTPTCPFSSWRWMELGAATCNSSLATYG